MLTGAWPIRDLFNDPEIGLDLCGALFFAGDHFPVTVDLPLWFEIVAFCAHTKQMRRFVFALLIAATPVHAQDATPVPPAEEGWSLMERGARQLFEGLMSEMEPTLDEMGRALSDIEPTLREMQPALRDLITLLGDIRYYKSPEKLPNGDIIIRRKTDAELRLEELTGPEIEL